MANAAGPAVDPLTLGESEAQDTHQTESQAEPTAGAQQPVPAKKKWEFTTIGYFWFAGVKGETDVIKPLEPVGLDLSFGDVLKALKFGLMGAAAARRDRLVILGDLTFIHVDGKKGIDIRDQDFLDAELDSTTAEITVLGGYRVEDKGPVIVDLVGGGRLNFFKTTLQLDGPHGNADGSVKQTWLDPLVGARAIVPLASKWDLTVYCDIGGFGIGSDLTWQGVATVNYQFSRRMSLGAGWRYFKVNYDRGDFLYNVRQSGPLITVRTIL